MERTYLGDSVVVSVRSSSISEESSEVKFLIGKVINDQTKQFPIGKLLITLELQLWSNSVFMAKDGTIFETSNSPSDIEISCAEFLLMRINSFKLTQILSIRECTDNAKLISTFDY
jgi:hypothetical protein